MIHRRDWEKHEAPGLRKVERSGAVESYGSVPVVAFVFGQDRCGRRDEPLST